MHCHYWIDWYIMSYPSDLCLIVSGSTIHNSLPPSILPYSTTPLPLPPITPSLYIPPPLMLHAPLLSIGYMECSDPTITLKVAVPASAPLPDTSPSYDQSQCIVQPHSSGRRYTPLYHPYSPLTEHPQWVGTPMSHTLDVWGPWLSSAVPPGDGNPQRPSPDVG